VSNSVDCKRSDIARSDRVDVHGVKTPLTSKLKQLQKKRDVANAIDSTSRVEASVGRYRWNGGLAALSKPGEQVS
jgi:hypothetical protein